jgi:phosphoglucomutase
VLTGFKFIGEQIGLLEAAGETYRYIFGFEESYGYLAGGYVRDKDAVVAAMLICEMVAYYKSVGKNLVEVLSELYDKYGYYYCSQKSFTCEGQAGMKQIADIMERLAINPPSEVDGLKVARFDNLNKSESLDIASGKITTIDLPKSNVLCFYLEDGSSLIVRPSGTEPKIKLYISAVGDTNDNAIAEREKLEIAGTKLLGF